LLNKKNYVCYSENLKFYLESGLRVTKVHKAIKCETRDFGKAYIEFNSKKRADAKGDEAARTMFKLFNNAIYGKSVENVAKRQKNLLFTDMEKARRMAEKPHLQDWKAFNDWLIALEMRKVNQLINKPFQMGFAVLELSKLLMFKSVASLKKHFGSDKLQVLYTDTDSLIIQFHVPDLYKDLQDPAIRDLFDFSEVPMGHPSGLGSLDDPNKGVVGRFKDESKGDLVVEYVGLKPKMYSYRVADCLPPDSNAQPHIHSKQVAKGMSRATKKTQTFDMYMNMFKNQNEAPKVVNRRIASHMHKVHGSK
jgi:hypothetical protein